MTPGSANLLLTSAAAASAYTISRSLRFRRSASAYLNRTPASASNQKTWTFSAWMKRGTIGVGQNFLDAGTLTGWQLYFNSSDQLQWSQGSTLYGPTTMVFRDPSAWYHIVFVWDTTQATASNRTKLYVNGVEQTAGLTYPNLNDTSTLNSVIAHYIGRYQNNFNYNYDGYMADVYLIDGQALTPSSFGQTNATTGVWVPKAYTGTYGTNGFYLNFSDNSAATAAAIGKDNSGNGNNFTPNNISLTAGVTYDSMIDTPTPYDDGTAYGRGNYCVMNPTYAVTGTAPTLTNGNLSYSKTVTATYGLSRGTMAVSSGKFYWEVTIDSKSTHLSAIGAENVDNGNTSDAYFKDTSYTYNSNGTKGNNNGTAAYGSSWTTGDVLGFALNMDAKTITFYKNNVSQGTAFTGLTGSIVPIISTEEGAGTLSASFNFGQRPFAYTPPSGYKALNTQNLPTPTIVAGNAWFDATTYTGNSSTQNIINSGAFSPNLVWIKSRSAAYGHGLFDTNRGSNIGLQSNNTNAENTFNASVTSFNANGFSLGADANLFVNENTKTFVAWQWKEGATPGFDIVTYTGPASPAAQNVAHSLGVKPEMMIVKARNLASRNWAVYHKELGATQCLRLNLTNAAASVSTYWNNTEPTSTQFTVGTDNDTNANTYNYVAYLFAGVEGFSKFGKYTGNGSADGPFVYCGFRPRWVLIRASNLGSAENWYIHDTARSTYNVSDLGLFPNLTNAEGGTGVSLDVLSNGFKPRSTATPLNSSGTTYIFAAFAENPFKYALAR